MDLKDGWVKNDFNGLEANYFHNHFVLTVYKIQEGKENVIFCGIKSTRC